MKKNWIRILLLLFCLLIWAWSGPQNPPQTEAGRQETEAFTPSETLPADHAAAFPVDI